MTAIGVPFPGNLSPVTASARTCLWNPSFHISPICKPPSPWLSCLFSLSLSPFQNTSLLLPSSLGQESNLLRPPRAPLAAAGLACAHAVLGCCRSGAPAVTPCLGKNTSVKETAFHSYLLPGHGPVGHFGKKKKSLKLEKLAWKKSLHIPVEGEKKSKNYHFCPREEKPSSQLCWRGQGAHEHLCRCPPVRPSPPKQPLCLAGPTPGMLCTHRVRGLLLAASAASLGFIL